MVKAIMHGCNGKMGQVISGLVKEDDVIEIIIGLPATTSAYVNGYEFIVNNYTEAVKGTKLEGKLTFKKDDTIGNAFGDALRRAQPLGVHLLALGCEVEVDGFSITHRLPVWL